MWCSRGGRAGPGVRRARAGVGGGPLSLTLTLTLALTLTLTLTLFLPHTLTLTLTLTPTPTLTLPLQVLRCDALGTGEVEALESSNMTFDVADNNLKKFFNGWFNYQMNWSSSFCSVEKRTKSQQANDIAGRSQVLGYDALGTGEVEGLMKEADLNKNGSIELQEFLTMVQGHLAHKEHPPP